MTQPQESLTTRRLDADAYLYAATAHSRDLAGVAIQPQHAQLVYALGAQRALIRFRRTLDELHALVDQPHRLALRLREVEELITGYTGRAMDHLRYALQHQVPAFGDEAIDVCPLEPRAPRRGVPLAEAFPDLTHVERERIRQTHIELPEDLCQAAPRTRAIDPDELRDRVREISTLPLAHFELGRLEVLAVLVTAFAQARASASDVRDRIETLERCLVPVATDVAAYLLVQLAPLVHTHALFAGDPDALAPEALGSDQPRIVRDAYGEGQGV